MCGAARILPYLGHHRRIQGRRNQHGRDGISQSRERRGGRSHLYLAAPPSPPPSSGGASQEGSAETRRGKRTRVGEGRGEGGDEEGGGGATQHGCVGGTLPEPATFSPPRGFPGVMSPRKKSRPNESAGSKETGSTTSPWRDVPPRSSSSPWQPSSPTRPRSPCSPQRSSLGSPASRIIGDFPSAPHTGRGAAPVHLSFARRSSRTRRYVGTPRA